MACEDANSKLEVVTVAVVDDEDPDKNSLLQIWKLRFCSDFDYKILSRY